MYEIDDDVPPPGRKLATQFPDAGPVWLTLKALKPGQSFFVAGATTLQLSRWVHRLRKQKPGRRYATRREGSGVRVWRIDREPEYDPFA